MKEKLGEMSGFGQGVRNSGHVPAGLSMELNRVHWSEVLATGFSFIFWRWRARRTRNGSKACSWILGPQICDCCSFVEMCIYVP